METVEDIEHDVAQFLDEQKTTNYEGTQSFSVLFGSTHDDLEVEGDDNGDLYNLDFTVTITETDTGEVDSEFVEALAEIEGKKTFSCSLCEKVCRSKGGLTRHINSKHQDAGAGFESETGQATLSKDTLFSMVESIKTKLIEDNLYGAEVNTCLTTVSPNETLFDHVLPMYEIFRKKKNQDKLLQSFYGLIPQSLELLNCQDFRVANLIMIHLPDHLVSFYNLNQTRQSEEKETASVQLEPGEHGPLSYIGGYIISKLLQKNKRKTGQENEELQSLLHYMKAVDQSSNSFIAARSRGGLITPCDDLLGILEAAEISFRKKVDKSNSKLRNIPTETICDKILESPMVKSLWDNIVLASGVNAASSTQKLCLENVIKLYLKVRAFSYARDYITKHKIKAKQTKKKALRKDMKQGDK